jgi:hypothetical protein
MEKSFRRKDALDFTIFLYRRFLKNFPIIFYHLQHLLNLRGVHGAILAERSDSKNRDIAESG